MSNTDEFLSYLDTQGLPQPGVIGEPQEPETVEPVEPAAETTEPEAVEPSEPLIFGKYKTQEAAEEGFKNLEREKGRLAQEVGELRQAVPQVPQVPQVPVDPSSVEDAFQQNPAAARQAAQSAATRALQQGDTQAYEQIIETWGQYDQFGALRFDGSIRASESARQIAAQIAPQVQTATQYADQHANEAATRNVQTRHPDFSDVVGDLADENRVSQILEAGFPPQLISAANGSQAEKEQLLETLYRWVKSEQAENVSRATTDAAVETAAQNRTTKQQSAVASASSQPASEGTSGNDEVLPFAAGPQVTKDQFFEFLRSPSPTSWADHRPTGQ